MEFVPTYLYIKQHRVTGLKYFGKTISDVTKYKGSGQHWKNHLAKHGDDVETIWYQLFTDEDSLIAYALDFSSVNNIVESSEWANLIPENGLDGYRPGHEGYKFTDEQLTRMSASVTERWADEEYKERLSQAHKDRWALNPELSERQSKRLKEEFWTDERKASHSQLMKDRVTDETVLRASVFFSNLERTDEHCARISQALKGKSKSAEHKRKQAISRQKIKGVFVDHTGSVYAVHKDFLEMHGLSSYFFSRLDTPVIEVWCSKLNIDYTSNTSKTWRDLGFGFIHQF